MFGLLDIKTCTLKKQTKKFYACNVCNAIAANYGRSSRLMLSNDAVYLSLLIAAQRASSYPINFPQCRPWSRKALSAPEFDYPAAVSLLTSGVNLVDDIADEKSVQTKLLYIYYQKKIKKAEENLQTFGISIPSIIKLVKLQRIREGKTGKNVEYYAKLTEDMYSSIFANTAILAEAPCNYQYLANIGRHVGRIAYLLDGYMDFEHDKKKRTFNIYNNCNGFSPENRTDHKRFFNKTINEGLQKIRDNISKINLYKYGDTIRYSVTDGLQARIQNIIQGKGIWLKQPYIYFAFVPLFFVLAQIDGGGDCCECDPGGAICDCYTYGPNGSSVAGNAGASAAQGAIGAATGGVVGEGLAQVFRKTSDKLISDAATKTVTSAEVKIEPTPEPIPKHIPASTGISSSQHSIADINRIKSRLPTGAYDQHMPLLDDEIQWLKADLDSPSVSANEKKIYENKIKESKENIKFDMEEEHERVKNGKSLYDESLEIWNDRPEAVDKYYSDLADYYKIPAMYSIPMSQPQTSLAGSLESKFAKSHHPIEQYWYKKWKSINRRKARMRARALRLYKNENIDLLNK